MRAKKSKAAATAAQHHALANDLARKGDAMAALRQRFEAFRALPGERAYRQALAAALVPLRLQQAAPAVEETFIRLLQADDVDAQSLSGALVSLIKAHPSFARLAAASDAAMADGESASAEGASFLGWPLLQHALATCILADSEVEAVLTGLRRSILLQGDSGRFTNEAVAALVLQAALTEYVWEESQAESDALAGLRARLEGDADMEARRRAALLYCAYGPTDAAAAAVLARDPAAMGGFGRLVHRRQVTEPAKEHALQDDIATLRLSDNAVSLGVRAQYEDNPYPRWTNVQRKSAKPLRSVVQSICEAVSPQSLPKGERPRVLVAGCGTGAHAVKVASRYAGSRVTAFDLSRAALAFAKRKAGELKLKNIRFLQADILALGDWEERFDLIECSGVLHHLADPLAGWRLLTGLLADKGLMRIGLYSAQARRDIVAMQALASEERIGADLVSIRRLRALIKAKAGEGDESAGAVLLQPDFYSASGCRDLLLHVQESRVTIAELQRALDTLGLEFLAFEHPFAETQRDFAKRYPGAAAASDLAAWHAFEAERPELFRSMYQFWCRKRDN